MNFYQIDYIYFLFPTLCILLSFTKKYKFFLSVYLIIFLGFSKIGSDYGGYLRHFNLHKIGVPLSQIHGELLFKLYMKLFVKIGLNYEIFRIIHITLFLSLICYFLYKLSKNYYYSLFILYCGYIIYLCSAYRQFISIVYMFIGFYFIKIKKNNSAILLNMFGLGFHISSILPLIFFIFYKFKKLIININKKVIIFLLLSCLMLRFLMAYLVNYITIILNLIGRGEHFKYYIQNIQLLPFSLLTRLIPFIIVLIFYKVKDNFENKIFIMYIFSILLYFLFPFELIMGRLTNNGRILECILFPVLIKQQNKKLNKNILKLFIITYFILVLINQLLKQDGYYPYINILF